MTDPIERRLRGALAVGWVKPDEPQSRTAAELAIARKRRRLTMMGTAVAVLLVAVGAAGIIRSDDHQTTSVTSGPVMGVGPTTAVMATFHWSELAPAPIAQRAAFASVWTGSELIVWGGASASTGDALVDGAAFNPSRGTWRVVAPGPLPAQTGPFSVWTGREMLIFGTNQAAYIPEGDHWREIPPPPARSAQLVSVLWAGSEAVTFRADGSVAAYEPSRDRWRSLPALPRGDATLSAVDPVHTGEALLAWTSTVSPSAGPDIDLFAFDPSAQVWVRRTHPDRPQGIRDPPIWTGKFVFIGAANRFNGLGSGSGVRIPGDAGILYDPKSDSYTPAAAGPLGALATWGTWTGRAVMQTAAGQMQVFDTPDRNVNLGDTAAWDAATNTWTRLQTAPKGIDFNGRTFWTGTALLAYGPMGTFRLGP